jgi:hypothetical protein
MTTIGTGILNSSVQPDGICSALQHVRLLGAIRRGVIAPGHRAVAAPLPGRTQNRQISC